MTTETATLEEPQDVFAAARVIRFAITGTAPFILERFQGFEKVEGKEETPESHVHRGDDGGIYIPTTCFRWSLLNGCRGRKIGMMAAANVVKAAVFTTPTRCVLLDPTTNAPITEFQVHERVITKGRGKNKTSETKLNPRIDAWKTHVDFEIDLAFVSSELIGSLLAAAGKSCGIGVGCPNQNGEFGTYTVKLVGEVK